MSDWYKKVKQAVRDNVPVIVTIGTTVAAVAAVMYVKDELDEAVRGNNELLKTIEEKIAIAIETPQIVKVEIGDDIELYGKGNRTD